MKAESQVNYSILRFHAIHVIFLFFLILHYPSSLTAFELELGEVYGSLDTTVSYGQIHRMQSTSRALVGPGCSDPGSIFPGFGALTGCPPGGTAFSVNGDDGNLNYESGLVSSTVKFTSELELNYQNFGAFVRATGFIDTSNNESNDTERTPLSSEAIELVGEDLKLLDAYVWADFDLGKMPVNIRVGEQVISWGESTFIQNSINVINPIDVSKLRLPGSELKEALLPVGIVSLSVGLTDFVSVEGFYQYDYERILIDPPGSYFSTEDVVGNGGQFLTVGFGAVPDFYGDTFGLITGTPTGFPAPITQLLAIPDPVVGAVPLGQAFTAFRSPDDRPDEGGQYGISARAYVPQLFDTELGIYFINYHSRLPLFNGIAGGANPLGIPLNIAGNPFAGVPFSHAGATYSVSYPEDIELFGVSFNTQVGTTGWALQGEYSFRNDTPLQIDTLEVILATAQATLGVGGPPMSQLGVGTPGSIVQGFIERDVSQFQATATKVFGPTFKADTALIVVEAAVTHVHDMPDESELRLEAAGTNLPANPFVAAAFGVPVETNDYADETSWGYRIVGRLEYNNVIGSINLIPRIGWRHDVSGNTPGPGGNFIEDFKQINVGISATYQNSWRADIGYTSFFGAGTQNQLQDRDFLSLSVSYSF